MLTQRADRAFRRHRRLYPVGLGSGFPIKITLEGALILILKVAHVRGTPVVATGTSTIEESANDMIDGVIQFPRVKRTAIADHVKAQSGIGRLSAQAAVVVVQADPPAQHGNRASEI
jgi:hypothetical protein